MGSLSPLWLHYLPEVRGENIWSTEIQKLDLSMSEAYVLKQNYFWSFHNVSVFDVYMCVYVCMCTHTHVGRRWHPLSFSIALLIFWSKVSPWSWSSLICLDWLVGKPGDSCLCHLQLGLQVHMHLTLMGVLGIQIRTLGYKAVIYQLDHVPRSFRHFQSVPCFLGERLLRVSKSKSPTHSTLGVQSLFLVRTPSSSCTCWGCPWLHINL